MALKEYHRKRDFTKTAEPIGEPVRTGHVFCVQKHAASHLHYDFRLQIDDVLVSWAVPKGPSLDPSEKRLAVHVEDHPFDYKDFEGTIPAGEYGGGTVMVWDQGTWEPSGDPRKGVKGGMLKFVLYGSRLQGAWMLVRLRPRPQDRDKRENWLLVKERDDYARPLDEGDVLAEETTSIVTGRTMDEIAEGKPARKRKAAKARKKAAPRAPRPKAAKRTTATSKRKVGVTPKVPGGRPAAFPKRLDHQLATLTSSPPEGDNWVHEIKWDGYRMFCRLNGDVVQFVSRNQQDWTDRMKSLANVAKRLKATDAILDGEVVVLDPQGVSHFQSLQNAFSGSGAPLVFYAFDLLHLNGIDLRMATLEDRKTLLKQLIDDSPQVAPAIRYSDHVVGSGAEFLKQAGKLGLEGTLSKRIDRPYVGGRGGDWLKNKIRQTQEFVIAGYTTPTGSRIGFGSLLLGCHQQGKFVYAGRVGTGFGQQALRTLSTRLKELQTSTCPFAKRPPKEGSEELFWVEPTLVAQVEFANWTDEGLLRQASFEGLREDKPAAEVRCDVPVKPDTSSARSTATRSKGTRSTGARRSSPNSRSSSSRSTTGRSTARSSKKTAADTDPLGSFRISNPDRVVYPDVPLTKRDVANYYASVMDWILPELARRPLSVVRCPEGATAACFFQKHPMPGLPEAVGRVPVEEKDGIQDQMYVTNREGLLSLIQFGVLELHTWGSRVDRIDRPDRMVFDLDPDPAVAWPDVIAACRELKEVLEVLELTSFLKNSGGKGLHVVVPLERKHTWEEVKEFSKGVAEFLARNKPDTYVSNMSKAQRKGKIFVDYLRNDYGSTSIAPYSTRSRPGAPVSTPLHWRELTAALGPAKFTVQNIAARLAKLSKDPWEGISSTRQRLLESSRKKLELA